MSTLFLVCSFFFPRQTLLLTWLFFRMPDNPTELGLDILGAIIAPRLLISYWLYSADQSFILVGLFGFAGVVEFLTFIRKMFQAMDN